MKTPNRLIIVVVLTILISLQGLLAAEEITINHVDPPMWWTGMQNPELMLVIHGTNISKLDPVIKYAGVTLQTTTRTENPNYLFLTLTIADNAAAGTVKIDFYRGKKVILTYPFELRERKPGSADRGSFGPGDVVYLLMPDRFSNGDPSNDTVENLKEKANRDDQDGRHGGDIRGIINNLDYLQELGITALWTTPLLEDDMATYSYHTYATTNYYKIDGRYGSNADYEKLAGECHRRGIKLIMDLVPNHCGSDHWWMKDMPMQDWVHQFPQFTRSNYSISTWNDPHASAYDRMLNANGWFDVSMPDLNQHNPFVLTYFKQLAIFWIEFAGLDGIRVDTYPYNDKWKIAEWTRSILREYPRLNIMGECWQHNPVEIAYWQSGVHNYDGYDSYLPAVMDFPLTDAFAAAFNEDVQQWDKGASRFYNVYALDYVYADPNNMLIFMDNHDTERFAEHIGSDVQKYKLAIAHLLTTRGIPQIYYGTEILMGGRKNKGDGDIRRDFPGGWPGDARNAFTRAGRTEKENEVFNYTSRLLNYRKNNPVLHTGAMIQFIPRENMYVYFRMNEEKTIMVVLNNSGNKKLFDTARFEECLNGRRKGKDILTDEILQLEGLEVEPKTALVLEIE
ncbi:MAG TPA: glycoside hydrolase family 13 protein [Bacteroidales bacterium]|nr:glycoside hydrolase family 13 protein [Bacteroidales bacterium]